jgi:enterochelin esterase family protein
MATLNKLAFILFALFCFSCSTPAVTTPEPESFAKNNLSYIHNLKSIIDIIEQTPDAAAQQKMATELFDSLKSQNRIPWISNDTIIFIYKSSGSSVHIAGDMTSWSLKAEYLAKTIGKTDIWYLIKTFPMDARLDYKIIINGSSWYLDTNNPKKQLSGFGYNSAFSMPDYDSSAYLIESAAIPKGTLSQAQIISSVKLERPVRFWVYTPSGYESMENLPSIYVTDGQEYKEKGMGSMKVVLDNLIAGQIINPLVAVFVDPVHPNTGVNQRVELFLNNPAYAAFFAEELVPAIDEAYKTDKQAQNRAILGTSYGGNNAAYFGYQVPGTFKLIAPQSPAFNSNVTNLYLDAESLQLNKVFITTGVINDTEHYANQLEQLLKAKDIPYRYIKVNEGHSWGNWSALLDDILIYFYGK